MTRTPVEVQDALFAKLREKFNDAQLVELTATLAWETSERGWTMRQRGSGGVY